jgi:hypothetical protein
MEMIFFEENGRRWLGTDEGMKSPYDFERIISAQPDLYRFFHHFSQTLPSAQTYVQQNKEYFGWTDWLLSQCSEFVAAPLMRPIRYDEPFWQCFENARARALVAGLYYVEGVVVTPTGVFVHAWNSTDGQDVLDYTYPAQECNSYFGVALNVGEKIPYGWLGFLFEETKEQRPGWATKQLELLECAA